jgi:hypothetical protein
MCLLVFVGIEFLQQEGMVDRDPAAVALFLAKTKVYHRPFLD